MPKYILVLSQDGDNSVDNVLHWISKMSDIITIRIHERDTLNLTSIETLKDGKTRFSILVNNYVSISSDKILCYWYRRGALAFNIPILRNPVDNLGAILHNNLKKYYQDEWEHTTDYVHYLLKESHIPSLNSYFDLKVNKLINIEVAKNLGLNVPESLISNDVMSIRKFLHKHERIIVKPIRMPGNGFYFKNKLFGYTQSTNLYNALQFEATVSKHKNFQPTLFQEYIEKEFEIRSYYMKGKFYSMAIFSQSNDKTKIDFRNYDTEKPNRNVPFKLPKHIETQANILMRKLNYDTGSLDFIYNNCVYTFLEVNTVGQFGWLSYNCNYYIERNIAKYLLKLSKNGF